MKPSETMTVPGAILVGMKCIPFMTAYVSLKLS